MSVPTIWDKIERLGDELRHHFDLVLTFPIEQIPGYPAVVITPQSPWIEPGTICAYDINVEVTVFLPRANGQEAFKYAADKTPIIAAAASAADATWESMTPASLDIGGVESLVSVHTLIIH